MAIVTIWKRSAPRYKETSAICRGRKESWNIWVNKLCLNRQLLLLVLRSMGFTLELAILLCLTSRPKIIRLTKTHSTKKITKRLLMSCTIRGTRATILNYSTRINSTTIKEEKTTKTLHNTKRSLTKAKEERSHGEQDTPIPLKLLTKPLVPSTATNMVGDDTLINELGLL